jgi:epoxyqueuosine reductase
VTRRERGVQVHEVKAKLKGYASLVGFDLMGVATAEPLTDAKLELNRRIQAGIYSPLVTGSAIERTTPTLLLPGAKSVIMVAMAYSVDPLLDTDRHLESKPRKEPAKLCGILSRYARGQDYHRVMIPRLHQLAVFLEDLVPGTTCRVMVDSGPLMEKTMAYRAGLGFFGWNSCLITEAFGSWVFLGSLLTTAALPPDPFQPRTCQECGRCMKACPTGAILAPYVVDPNLCLSQVTQTRGIMPDRFLKPLGSRLFGCDTCQEVCPHNRGIKLGSHPEFAPHPQIGSEPWLEMVVTSTNRSFKATFGQIAAGWRGKKVLQRNALINLGNIGNQDTIPLLIDALDDPTEPVRAAAHWALANIQARN